MKHQPQPIPVSLGTVIKLYGKVGAVGITGGERYYWLVNADGGVTMMPWFVIEQPSSQ